MRPLVLVAALAASAAAQPVTLAPGHPDLEVGAVSPESGVLTVTVGDRPAGAVRSDLDLEGGVLTVVTSTAVPMAGPPSRDSTRMTWPGLRPLAHALDGAGSSGGVRYLEGSASRTWGPAGAGAPLAFDLERPVFAPAALPFVIRALPLGRPGYQAVVPLFSTKDRLTVVGPETVVLEDGTEVEAVAVDQGGGGGLTRGFAQRHLVDPATREVVRTTLAPPGMTVVVEPASPAVAATVWPVRALPPSPPVALVPGHPDLALEDVALEDGRAEMRYTAPEPRPTWDVTETVTRDGDVVTIAMSAVSASDAGTTVRDTVRVR